MHANKIIQECVICYYDYCAQGLYKECIQKDATMRFSFFISSHLFMFVSVVLLCSFSFISLFKICSISVLRYTQHVQYLNTMWYEPYLCFYSVIYYFENNSYNVQKVDVMFVLMSTCIASVMHLMTYFHRQKKFIY